MNPALRFKKRLEAKLAGKPAPTANQPARPAPITEQSIEIKQSLKTDLQTLKLLNGDEQRLPVKKDFIEKYRALCEELMGYKNWARLEVLFWWLMWRLDVDGFETVHSDMLAGVLNGLTTPSSFSRDFQTIYLDEVNNYTQNALKAKVDFDEQIITKAIQLLTSGQIATNAALKAKLFAAHGKVAILFQDFATAEKSLTAALQLDDRVGVKKLLAEVKEELAQEKNGEENE